MVHAATHPSGTLAKVSTNAARDAAFAAKTNADTVLNAERPWLFMVPSNGTDDPRTSWIKISVINRGRTPAEIVNFIGDFNFIDPENLPETPKYKLTGMELSHKRYLAPGDPPFQVYDFDCGAIMSDTQWKKLREEMKRLVFFGRVVYRDLIKREDHETRFCYFLSPVEWVGLIMCGPPEWNRHT
jgi:hypothetical protein